MSTKTIIYPHILACRDLTLDPYWKEIITSCASNKFPKGVKYDNIRGIIHVRYEGSGGKSCGTESIVLPDKTEELYSKLMHSFKNLIGLRSPSDIKLGRDVLEDIRKKNEIDIDCEWKKLKPRFFKNYILMNYAISKIYEHNLPPKKSNTLYKLIQLGFQFKQLSSDDIEYKKGTITNIKGLKYDSSKNF